MTKQELGTLVLGNKLLNTDHDVLLEFIAYDDTKEEVMVINLKSFKVVYIDTKWFLKHHKTIGEKQ